MAVTPAKTELGHPGGIVATWGEFAQIDDWEDAPQLRWPESVNTLHRMRTDAQVDALSRAVTLPVRRWQWVVDPAGAKDEVTERIASDLSLPILGSDEIPKRTRRRFSHDHHLRHALLGLWYGHMFFEKLGVAEDDGSWRLRKLAPRMPQSIAKFEVERDGGLRAIYQHDDRHGFVGRNVIPMGPYTFGIKLPIERLVAYVWEQEGANWYGRSMYRPLYRHWLIKDRLIRIDAMKNERFGVGIPTGKAPKGGEPDKYAAMAQSVRAAEGSGVGLPDGAEMYIEGIRGTLPDTIGSIQMHDEAMARSFLAMFMQLGQTQTGSRALGNTFVDFFQLGLEAIANWYAEMTSEYLIEDMVDWNYGEDEAAPRLTWTLPAAPEPSISDLVALIDAGVLQVDKGLDGWARQRLSIPPPTEPLTPQLAEVEPTDPFGRLSTQPGHGSIRVAAHLQGKHDQRTHGNKVATGAAKFAAEGGVIHVADEAMTVAAQDTFTQMEESMPPEWYGDDLGVQYTSIALQEHLASSSESHLFIAEADGLAGAVHVLDIQGGELEEAGTVPDFIYVSHLGTTGLADGTASALMMEVATYAASRNVPVLGDPIPSAEPFWKALGWEPDPTGEGTDLWGWSAETAGAIAGAKKVAAHQPGKHDQQRHGRRTLHRGLGEYTGDDGDAILSEIENEYGELGAYWGEEQIAEFYANARTTGAVITAEIDEDALMGDANGYTVRPGTLADVVSVKVLQPDGTWKKIPHTRRKLITVRASQVAAHLPGKHDQSRHAGAGAYDADYVARGVNIHAEVPKDLAVKMEHGTITADELIPIIEGENGAGEWWGILGDAPESFGIEAVETYTEGSFDPDLTVRSELESGWEYGGGELKVLLVGKRPAVNDAPWNPIIGDGEAYVPHSVNVIDLVEIRYDAGWGWQTVDAIGRSVRVRK